MHDHQASGSTATEAALEDAQWTARTKERRPRNRWLSRILAVATWMICVFAAAAVYMNVLTDDAPVRSRTDAFARHHAGCEDKCVVTHVETRRSVLDYRADYAFDKFGEVHVTCRRSAIVAGEHECRAQ